MTLSFVLINHSKGGAKDLILAQTGWYSSLLLVVMKCTDGMEAHAATYMKKSVWKPLSR